MIYVLLYVVFGAMFLGGTIFYWVSSRPFRWVDEYKNVE